VNVRTSKTGLSCVSNEEHARIAVTLFDANIIHNIMRMIEIDVFWGQISRAGHGRPPGHDADERNQTARGVHARQWTVRDHGGRLVGGQRPDDGQHETRETSDSFSILPI
jgi:hypothetical protein